MDYVFYPLTETTQLVLALSFSFYNRVMEEEQEWGGGLRKSRNGEEGCERVGMGRRVVKEQKWGGGLRKSRNGEEGCEIAGMRRRVEKEHEWGGGL